MTGPVSAYPKPNCYEVIVQVKRPDGQAYALRYQIETRLNRETHHTLLTEAYDNLMRQADA